ncbi:hypothetical protein [Paracoccus spongiarum]|uniref:ATP synthase F0 subunit B n=1 Tax=Paracoccus spongiarum TaxID=3064387 RepID=A0ABT9JGG8_9RHOB|nr:hypothetical protein [Paracoccus sp. 2205BS29-5]MDP5308937.1 hypothetical protein [Paracoccus sp. 2205BS29-5]
MGLFAFLSMVAIYGLGGYVAGRMRTRTSTSEDEIEARDGIHGLTVWALGMILSGLLAAGAVGTGVRTVGSAATSAVEAAGSAVGGVAQGTGQLAGGIVGGVGQIAGGAISGVGQLAGGVVSGAGNAAGGQQMGGNPLDYVTDRLLRSEASAPDQFSNEQIRSEVLSILGSVLRTGDVPDEDLDEDLDYLRDALAARTSLTPAQIDARVEDAVTRTQALRDEAEKRLTDARAEAEEALAAAEAQAQKLRDETQQRVDEAQAAAVDAAEAARSAAVWSALFLAVSSLVAGLAAWMGAIRGGSDRDAGRVWTGLTRRR